MTWNYVNIQKTNNMNSIRNSQNKIVLMKRKLSLQLNGIQQSLNQNQTVKKGVSEPNQIASNSQEDKFGKTKSHNPETVVYNAKNSRVPKQNNSDQNNLEQRSQIKKKKKAYKYPIIKFSQSSDEKRQQVEIQPIIKPENQEKYARRQIMPKKLSRINSEPILSNKIQLKANSSLEIQSEHQFSLDLVQHLQNVHSEQSKKQIQAEVKQIQNNSQSQSSIGSVELGQPKQCQVCYQMKDSSRFDQPFNCQHQFCKRCLKNYSKRLLKEHRIIRCPAESCEQVIKETSITFSSFSELQKKKYTKILFEHQINGNPDLHLCPNPLCEVVGFITINKNNKSKGKCENCVTTYCLECMLKEHRGKCVNNQVEFLNDKYKYQKCVKCKRVIERKQGCPHMTCICGYQFCYGCGCTWKYSHNCWKNRLGNKKSIFEKLQELLAFSRVEDTNINNFSYFFFNFPHNFMYFMLIFLWFSWTIIFALIVYPLILVGCLAFGYFFVLCSMFKESRHRCGPRIGVFLMIIFSPICFPAAGIVCFVAFTKEKTHEFLIDPCMRGQLFPILRCSIP